MELTARGRFRAAGVYGVLAILASIWLLRDAFMDKLLWAMRQGDGDSVVNWLGARAWERGIDPYSPAGLRWAGLPSLGHPPTTALWYLPFTSFGIFELSQLYGHLLLLLLLVHVLLLVTEQRLPVALPTAILAYALVMDTAMWRDHVHMIQVSEPIAFLYVLAWIFLRRDREIAAGIAIGLAITLKPYAGLLVIMLLVGRRWRGAIAACVTAALIAIVAAARFGLAAWGEFFAMLPSSQNHWTADIRNASVQGIVLRWWHPACGGGGPTLVKATILATLLCLAILAAICWLSRRALAPKQPAPPIDEAIDLPFCLFAIASAWMNPVVWDHYQVTLLQPIAIALAASWRLRDRGWKIWTPLLTAVIALAALSLRLDLRQSVARIAGSPSRHLWLHLYEVANWLPWPLMLATCAALVWRAQRRARFA